MLAFKNSAALLSVKKHFSVPFKSDLTQIFFLFLGTPIQFIRLTMCEPLPVSDFECLG